MHCKVHYWVSNNGMFTSLHVQFLVYEHVAVWENATGQADWNEPCINGRIPINIQEFTKHVDIYLRMVFSIMALASLRWVRNGFPTLQRGGSLYVAGRFTTLASHSNVGRRRSLSWLCLASRLSPSSSGVHNSDHVGSHNKQRWGNTLGQHVAARRIAYTHRLWYLKLLRTSILLWLWLEPCEIKC